MKHSDTTHEAVTLMLIRLSIIKERMEIWVNLIYISYFKRV